MCVCVCVCVCGLILILTRLAAPRAENEELRYDRLIKCLAMRCDYCCVERLWPKIDPLPTELPISTHHVRHLDTSLAPRCCLATTLLFLSLLLPFSPSFGTFMSGSSSGRLSLRYLPLKTFTGSPVVRHYDATYSGPAQTSGL